MTRLTRAMLGCSTTIASFFFSLFFVGYCSNLAAYPSRNSCMYTFIAIAEFPKEMNTNPTEFLGVMICELKDQDLIMTAVGSGLRLVEQVFTAYRTIFDPVAFISTLYLCETSHWFRIVGWPFHPLLSIPCQWIAVCQQRSAIATTAT